MAPLALALHLALASAGSPALAPDLTPDLDPGPFRGSELALASAGVLAGDVAVAGVGYLALQLFASGAVDASATNFRRTAYALLGTALVLPPLTSVLLARLSGRTASRGFWKGLLLASAGHVLALGAGYLAAPHIWVTRPVQLLAVSIGTSVGLHWGRAAGAGPSSFPSRPSSAPPLPTAGEQKGPEAPSASLGLVPVCPAT
jgi:hypothetical protein